ncbi:MAG: DUF983 domain-containing protein [Rhodospirillales bacterium]|nr:DUF983 domain-containing protein [Rhodospirillales bacterium]
METIEAVAVKPSLSRTLWRGLLRSCPQCGGGRTLHSYLKVKPACSECGEALGHIRADDFPPYLTIIIVGHIIVPLLLLSERTFSPPTWVQMTVWPLASLALLLMVLPVCKGFCVNLMWHLGLKGDER